MDQNRSYVLLLLENDSGLREFELRELSKKAHPVLNSKCIFTSEIIPTDLLLKGDLFGIAENVRLEGGDRFLFDSNGRWNTLEEFEEFQKGFKRGFFDRLKGKFNKRL